MPFPSPSDQQPQVLACESGTGSAQAARVTAAHYGAALDRARRDGISAAGIAMYIHLPFCPSRCLSCDHQTTVTQDSRDIDDYLQTLAREMELVAERLGAGSHLSQLHLGGGTPNYLSDTQLVRLMAIVERHFTLDTATDTSLEANPRHASQSQLELLRGLGFRRLQFEVRDLEPEVQAALGRVLSTSMMQDVFANARQAGFESIGMDIVYGLPSQTRQTMRRTLLATQALAPDRIACLSYSRRPESFSHQRAIDAGSLPSLADKLALFYAIADHLQEGGYQWIGLDCFARSDDALSIAHTQQRLHRNWIGYTTLETDNMLGFGAHAVTELNDLCVQNHPLIPDWMSAVDEDELPVCGGVEFSPGDREQRRAMNDLMCNMTLADYAALRRRQGNQLSPLEELEQQGVISVSDHGASVTPEGRYLLHQTWGDASPVYRWRNAMAG